MSHRHTHQSTDQSAQSRGCTYVHASRQSSREGDPFCTCTHHPRQKTREKNERTRSGLGKLCPRQRKRSIKHQDRQKPPFLALCAPFNLVLLLASTPCNLVSFAPAWRLAGSLPSFTYSAPSPPPRSLAAPPPGSIRGGRQASKPERSKHQNGGTKNDGYARPPCLPSPKTPNKPITHDGKGETNSPLTTLNSSPGEHGTSLTPPPAVLVYTGR